MLFVGRIHHCLVSHNWSLIAPHRLFTGQRNHFIAAIVDYQLLHISCLLVGFFVISHFLSVLVHYQLPQHGLFVCQIHHSMVSHSWLSIAPHLLVIDRIHINHIWFSIPRHQLFVCRLFVISHFLSVIVVYRLPHIGCLLVGYTTVRPVTVEYLVG